jgi:hypothetical protein
MAFLSGWVSTTTLYQPDKKEKEKIRKKSFVFFAPAKPKL